MPLHRRFKGHKDLELEHAQALLRCRHRSSQVRDQQEQLRRASDVQILLRNELGNTL